MPAPLLELAILDQFRRAAPDHIGGAARRRFPARLNRYLIASSYLFHEAERRQRPLRVCEIGISRGFMGRFVVEATRYYGLDRGRVSREWIGVDVDLSRLHHADSYDRLLALDVEREPVPADCDAYILLHVLEHLRDPVAAMHSIRAAAADDALFVIGVPSQPHLLSAVWEQTIRRQPNANGHVSVFSRRRLLRLLADLNLRLEDERAGYVLRASGLPVEDSAWWQGWNLSLGQRFPGFPGEYLVCARK